MRGVWWVGVYTTYGDESADETKRRVFAMATLTGPEQTWQALSDKWEARTGGVTFHAADCESDQGVFAGRDHAENLALYRDLVQIIAGSGLWGCAVAVDLTASERFFPGNMDDPPVPYLLCFEGVVTRNVRLVRAMTQLYASKHKVDPGEQGIEFIFDRNADCEYSAALLYDFYMKMPGSVLREHMADVVSFASRETVGIQVSDLIAREAMKDLDNRIGPIRRPRRKSMEALMRSAAMFEYVELDETYFREMATNVERINEIAADVQQYKKWLDEKGLPNTFTQMCRYMLRLKVEKGAKTKGGVM